MSAVEQARRHRNRFAARPASGASAAQNATAFARFTV